MPVLQKKVLFSAFIICQVLRIIQNYMEVSPAKSLILSATIHGGSYFFIQPTFRYNGHQTVFFTLYEIYFVTLRGHFHFLHGNVCIFL